MGIVTKSVSIKLKGLNVKYYSALGYELPKHMNNEGSEINVDISDLKPNSNVKILVRCDRCGKIVCEKNGGIKFSSYNKYVKEDGTYYCRKCALSNGISFKQWCDENNRQDVLDRWDYELNKCSPDEITYSSGKKYWFKCPKGIHESEIKNINSFTNNNFNKTINCKACNSFAQWGIDNICEDFLEKYWDYDKNIVNPYKIDKCSKKKVWIKCQEELHKNYIIQCCNFVIGRRCPECKNSKGEKRIFDYIINNNINYEFQKTFEGLIGTGYGLLSYDFYLPDHNMLIEYQGEFHDGSTGDYSSINLKKQQEHDRRKKQYAEDNKINLLEIWYYDFESIEKILDFYNMIGE